jgi:SAM-dependent methyltransferase
MASLYALQVHWDIRIAGKDTAQPRNLAKRVALVLGAIGQSELRVLDCGCGAGHYLPALARYGAKVYGVEFLDTKLEAARGLGLAGRIVRADLEKLPFASDSFDAVMFNEVLEHVPDDGRALAEAHRILVRGGHLCIFSPNRRYPFETHGTFLKYRDILLPFWTPFVPWVPVGIGSRFLRYWARNYWPGELRALVRKHGFEIESASYVWQTFEGLSGSFLSSRTWLRPPLRAVASLLEQTPVLRSFGVSQWIHARKTVR